jgi:hypothetical protein
VKWVKKGLVYGPDGSMPWAKRAALTPTPLLLNEDTIRIYAGFRDERGVSRIGFVDVASDNPSKVKTVSREPVLDVGLPGTFDDNGVILGDIIEHNDHLLMYYVGFQLVEKVKFLAYSGLAISRDDGNSFVRHSNAPVLDRSNRELYIRAIHSAMFEDGKWKIWCGVGSEWEYIQSRVFPKYHIRYYESADGIDFPDEGAVCFNFEGDEYRLGRHTIGTLQKDYVSGYAESDDGVNWTRKDHEIGIERSESGWDSEMLCYPSLLTHGEKTYMFYNGNGYGDDGFGYAELIEW